MSTPITISIKNLHLTLAQPLQGETVTTFLEQFFSDAPAVGDNWPEQGGVLAGIIPPQNDYPAYYLIVADDAAGETESLQWGGYGKSAEATSSWDGQANTDALMRCENDHPAARFCRTLKLHGKGDWYLPSRREASLMAATVPHLFGDGWYWTSTQYSADSAFAQGFSGGGQDGNPKDSKTRVRAVRRFLINSPI